MSENTLQAIVVDHGMETQLLRVSEASPYVIDTLNRYQNDFVTALNTGFWLSAVDYTVENSASLAHYSDILDSDNDNQCKQSLRKFRNFHSARLLWHDLNSLIDWKALLKAQSDLADLCVQATLKYLERDFAQKYHLPEYSDGTLMQLGVVAMGKWGGCELNFSSDIDFILLYGENTEVVGKEGRKDMETHQYFTKISQRLIRLLDDVSADGFVYRCDTRLRPFGDSGPLVVSVAALEQYLTRHGREWERYAYLKARCVTGDKNVIKEFEDLRRPFVYRRYLDYGVFSKLRDMHSQIAQQVKKKAMQENLKLGRGGIRECEFLVQAMQLLRGGRIKALQCSNFSQAYAALQDNDIWLDQEQKLFSAYVYLRIIENRLQAIQQEQTHLLPKEHDKKQCLLAAMQVESWTELMHELDRHRKVVSSVFSQQMALLNISNQEIVESRDFYTTVVELENESRELHLRTLEVQNARWYKNLSEAGREKLHAVLILFFSQVKEYRDASQPEFQAGVENFFLIIRAIGQRAVYFSLLVERPAALSHLLKVCFASEYLCKQIAQRPILLDELLDARIFKEAPTRQEIAIASEQFLSNAKASALEDFVNDLVVHKHVQMFRIACADIFQSLPLMKVSDCLSDLAVNILSIVCRRVLKESVKKYALEDMSLQESGFAILAYGKLGGLELSYTSDLDIVFLYDVSAIEKNRELASNPELCIRFYTRLVQQCISYLNMPTSMGRLYEIDTRLRPSGKSGFLISSLQAFENYQKNEAWVWEHQALTRARVVLASEKLKNKIEDSRIQILQNAVKREGLAAEILSMRDKMYKQFSSKQRQENIFHLKQSKGGMIDCEFLVQYLVLSHAEKFTQLLSYSDNIRQLEALAEVNVITQQDADDLILSYIALRDRSHKLSLQSKEPITEVLEMREYSEIIQNAWKRYLATDFVEN